jgi:glucosylceramidase
MICPRLLPAFALCIFAVPVLLPAQNVQVLETRADGSALLAHRQTAFAETKSASQEKVTLTIDPSARLQQMDGFGGSLTDSSASLIMSLPPAQRDELMREIFDPSGPLGLTLLREPIGASDFSSQGDYSYDDVPSGQTDPSLQHFSVAPDERNVFPLLREALHLDPQLRIMALPWSAPAWMKTSHTMKGGSLADSLVPVYAQYLERTVEAYAAEGLPLFALALQNEPLNENLTYPTQLMKPEQEIQLAKALKPLLNHAGRTPLLFGYEHNWNNLEYPNTLLAQTTPATAVATPPLFAGISFHCYAGNESAQLMLLRDHPETSVWFTECSGVNGTSFGADLLWQSHHLLLGAPLNGARSVLLWNLVLDPHGSPHNGGCHNCRALLTMEAHAGKPTTFQRNVEFYVLAHAAPFVHPGATRVAAAFHGEQGLLSTAYENADGTYAVLVLNEGPADTKMQLLWKDRALSYTVPGRSLLTFTWGDPHRALVEGTYAIALSPDGATVLQASRGAGVPDIVPGNASPAQLWTLKRLADDKFEVRNLATAQSLALTPRGGITTISLDAEHVAIVHLHLEDTGICLVATTTQACGTENNHLPLVPNQLLYLVAPEVSTSDKNR